MNECLARVLIVEDEESLRRSLRGFLEDDGFCVTTVASGEEGLRFLDECIPDAAIVDLRLPGMDGDAFIAEALERHSGIRFIVYTGSVAYKPSSRLRAAGIGEEHIFRKPLPDLSVLVDAVKGRRVTEADHG
jgi:DNA-binding response OmpR family regulator